MVLGSEAQTECNAVLCTKAKLKAPNNRQDWCLVQRIQWKSVGNQCQWAPHGIPTGTLRGGGYHSLYYLV